MELNKIYNEDCLIGMNRIPDKSVDMILCDLPYGTTKLKWDIVIPFVPLWTHYERIIKDNGAIVLTGSQPFTTDIINSNRRLFRYEIIWEKTIKSGFLDANRRPLKAHENILLFYKKQGTYNPQKTKNTIDRSSCENKPANRSDHYNLVGGSSWLEKGERYPGSVLQISNWKGSLFGNTDKVVKHPTSKPVELFSWLIRTYTNPGDLVLDNCMGSGTTAISCIQEGRNYLGFERSPTPPHDQYYKVCIDRIEKELSRPEQLKLIV